ncbi:protein SOSEKI 3-like isoform X2 [Phragmites australis]|uniref:protein SOSEKI 3-like isoform X2 n=1 Tax=Phragmites australis TaxID=29695 RepID=UPI002D7923D8|nr:protein SOSEKI 3-like isoform X2 [Phragmites australis]
MEHSKRDDSLSPRSLNNRRRENREKAEMSRYDPTILASQKPIEKPAPRANCQYDRVLTRPAADLSLALLHRLPPHANSSIHSSRTPVRHHLSFSCLLEGVVGGKGTRRRGAPYLVSNSSGSCPVVHLHAAPALLPSCPPKPITQAANPTSSSLLFDLILHHSIPLCQAGGGMEGRPTRRRGTGTGTSPGRNKVWVEPPGKSHHHQTPARSPPPPPAPAPASAKRVAVVYYLCRNRHLEHPHFIEVPLASPEEGLYLRDVINRLNVLRGKGMAAMYSWSCKRSYKNGFVWHDLSEDDPVLPAQGNEYILKGSEVLDRMPLPDRQQNGVGNAKVESLKQPKEESPQSRGSQEGCSSSSSPSAVVKEVSSLTPTPRPQQQAQSALLPSSSASTNREGEQCRTPHSVSSGNQSPEPAGRNVPLSEASSGGPSEYRVCKPMGAQDASTQTDDGERDVPEKHTHMAGMSTEDGISDAEIQECHQRSSQVSPKGPEIVQESPPVCSSDASPGGRVETLESLIRAEASRRSSFRTLEEEHMFGPMGVKLKPANFLMQLITCGSITVNDHRGFGFIPTYRPRFTQVEFPSPVFSTPMALQHLDKMPCNARTIGMRTPESEYFSGSLVETKKQDESGRRMSTLKRSSSYDEDRVYRASHCKSDTESSVESGSFRCLPQTIKMISCKQSRSGTILSPISDVRNSSSQQEYSTRSSQLGPSLGKLSSSRVESFHEEDMIKIEESFLLELGL